MNNNDSSNNTNMTGFDIAATQIHSSADTNSNRTTDLLLLMQNKYQLCVVMSLIVPTLTLYYQCISHDQVRSNSSSGSNDRYNGNINNISLVTRYEHFMNVWNSNCLYRQNRYNTYNNNDHNDDNSNDENTDSSTTNRNNNSNDDNKKKTNNNADVYEIKSYESYNSQQQKQNNNNDNDNSNNNNDEQDGPPVSIIFIMCYMIAITGSLQLLTSRYVPYIPLESERNNYYYVFNYYHSSHGNNNNRNHRNN